MGGVRMHDDNPRKADSKSHLKKDVKKDKRVYHIPISPGTSEEKSMTKTEAQEPGEHAIVKPESEPPAIPSPAASEIAVEAPKEQEAGAADAKEAQPSDRNEQIRELEERLKRISADFENFRRRKEEEVTQSRKYASERIIVELLTVIDNFERALTSSQTSVSVDSLMEGVQMIYRQLKGILEKEGLSEIQAQGEPFDPALHQAVMMVENTDLPDETVTEVLQKGYRLKERVVRPSMVKVSRKI
jgi:molecular chaperone GrpE